MSVQRPFYPEGEVCHLYLLHPPGGVVAGDCLTIQTQADSGSHALVTTPAAGKFYRSEGGRAHQSICLNIANGGVIEWLPQETIVYEGARLTSKTRLAIQTGARFIAWEMMVLGRPASNEAFNSGEVLSEWHITRDDEPIYLERLRLDPKAFSARWGLNGRSTCGSLFAYPANQKTLEAIRDLIGDKPERGVTCIDNLLICRALDQRSDKLRDFFNEVWMIVRETTLGRKACMPRIWTT
ncbi:MAG: urease accessory protein UreD [Methylomicrobium sp.]